MSFNDVDVGMPARQRQRQMQRAGPAVISKQDAELLEMDAQEMKSESSDNGRVVVSLSLRPTA